MSSDKTEVVSRGDIHEVRSSQSKSWMGIWFQGGFAALAAAAIIALGHFFMDKFSDMQLSQEKQFQFFMEKFERVEERHSAQLRYHQEKSEAMNERHWKSWREVKDALDQLRMEVLHRSGNSPPTTGKTLPDAGKSPG